VITWLSKNENKQIHEAVKELGIASVSENELEKLLNGIIEKNKELIEKRGEASFGALMGVAMKELRGKADAELVSKILKRKISETQK
jgi:glutamyl-tRNA(Gln) amidotransferase subunit E